jgi:hypothetical protein
MTSSVQASGNWSDWGREFVGLVFSIPCALRVRRLTVRGRAPGVATQGVPMEEKQLKRADLERLCVSRNDEPCSRPATVDCSNCGRWFCDAHAEDEQWHPCALAPGDEGGEA